MIEILVWEYGVEDADLLPDAELVALLEEKGEETKWT